MYQNHLEDLLECRLLGHISVSDSVGLGGPKICISSKFPGDAVAAGIGGKPLV